MLGGDRARRAATERREAFASWTEMLRDTLEAGRGLETAIAASAPVAPRPIRADVEILAAELRTPARLDAALRRFAARGSDPTCDRVVAGLLMRRGNETLGNVLTAIAVQTREDVEVRRRNDIEQARVRWTARTIVVITAVMALGLVLLDRDYLAPYDSATGQLVLCLVGGMMAVGYWSISRLAAGPPSPRLLVAEDEPGW
jgi:Flp pilus assembly protein TadB